MAIGVNMDSATAKGKKVSNPKVGLLTGGYFEFWRMYPGLEKVVEKEMKDLFTGLSKRDDIEVIWSGLADTVEKNEEAGKKFRDENVDLLVICEGSYFPDYMPVQAMDYIPGVPVLILATQPHNHVPLDMDYQDAIHHSFGIVGVVQLSGAFKKMGVDFDVLVSSLDDPSIYRDVADYAKVVKAVRGLRHMNIGIVGHTFQGMYDLELDKTKLKAKIGPNIIYIEVASLLSIWRNIEEEKAAEAAGTLKSRFVIDGPKDEDIKNSCRLALAMEELAEKYKLSGLSHLCQHLVHVETGTTPCYAATRLIEKGVMVTCEGDLGNLVMMCLIHALTGGPAVCLEWAMYDVKHNAMLMVHHGAGSPLLAKSDNDVSITPTGEKWGFKGTGASFRYAGKPGPVTVASLIHDKDGWKMLISSGEVIDVPARPYYGQQFMVKMDQPIKEYLKKLCLEGVTHHAILTYGNIRENLKTAAKLMGIRQVVV